LARARERPLAVSNFLTGISGFVESDIEGSEPKFNE
jgi:hypothetical protein